MSACALEHPVHVGSRGGHRSQSVDPGGDHCAQVYTQFAVKRGDSARTHDATDDVAPVLGNNT